MAKAVDRSMRLTDVHVVRKAGGQSGDWQLEADGSQLTSNKS
jgi:molybdenum cofactor biosynthesis enzyme